MMTSRPSPGCHWPSPRITAKHPAANGIAATVPTTGAPKAVRANARIEPATTPENVPPTAWSAMTAQALTVAQSRVTMRRPQASAMPTSLDLRTAVRCSQHPEVPLDDEQQPPHARGGVLLLLVSRGRCPQPHGIFGELPMGPQSSPARHNCQGRHIPKGGDGGGGPGGSSGLGSVGSTYCSQVTFPKLPPTPTPRQSRTIQSPAPHPAIGPDMAMAMAP